jgi:hypothetical protein
MYEHLDILGGSKSILWIVRRGLKARQADFASHKPVRFEESGAWRRSDGSLCRAFDSNPKSLNLKNLLTAIRKHPDWFIVARDQHLRIVETISKRHGSRAPRASPANMLKSRAAPWSLRSLTRTD